MGIGDKVSHAAEEATGKVKETIGRVTGNKGLQAEGAADQTAAKGKKIVERVKDSAARAVKKIRNIAK